MRTSRKIFLMFVNVVVFSQQSCLIQCFLISSIILPWAITKFTLMGIYSFYHFIPPHCRVICDTSLCGHYSCSSFSLDCCKVICDTFILTFMEFSFYYERYMILRGVFLSKGLFCLASFSHVLPHLWRRLIVTNTLVYQAC